MGSQISWGMRFSTNQEVRRFISELTEEVVTRIRSTDLWARKVVLTVKRKASEDSPDSPKYLNPGEVKAVSKSSRIPFEMPEASFIASRCYQLYGDMNLPPAEIRGIAIHLEGLEPRQSSSKKGAFSPLLRNLSKRLTPTSHPTQDCFLL